jgi:hypothetical protein
MKKEEVKVVRVDHTAPMPEKKEVEAPKQLAGKKPKPPKPSLHKKPKFGILKGGKTARNKPRFEGVKDPAKAPPSKKSKTLRILTDKGLTLRRRKIVDEASKTPIGKIRHTLRAHGLPIKDSTPDKIARKIYEDAQEAGMISAA